MSNQTEMNFIRALFDFKFRHFITLKVLRVLYAIYTGLILVGGSVVFLGGLISFFSDISIIGFVIIVIAPIGTLLLLIINRLIMEFYANLYRIGEHTQKMADQIQPKI